MEPPFEVRKTPEGRFTALLTCTCGSQEEIGNDENLPPQVLKKTFRARGWTIRKKTATCPGCIQARTQERRRQADQKRRARQCNTEVAVAEKTKASDNVTPIRQEIDAKTLRRIYGALEDHFDEDKGQYREGYSDARIAKELDLSEAVIAKTRREAFGEIKVPQEILDLHKEADELKQMIVDLQTRLETTLKKYR